MIEQIISLIAPAECVSCGVEGAFLCRNCLPLLPQPTSKCALCGTTAKDSVNLWCATCLTEGPLAGLLSACSYQAEAKELVHLLKFERARSVAESMASAIAPLLTHLPTTETWVIPVPTATVRVRARGYDQAALIARHLAKDANAVYTPLLRRTGKLRQVGASRKDRQQQLLDAFWSTKRVLPAKVTYVLVDDVITTGSSMQAAATVLRNCGANTIIGVSFASA